MPAYSIGSVLAVFTVTCAALLGFMLFLSWCVRSESRSSRDTYECGFPAEGKHRGLGFNFIGYAALFLVFDLAALYLFLFTAVEAPSAHVTVSFIAGITLLILLIMYGTRERKYYVA